MGVRGPKSKFDGVACPNPQCADHSIRGAGNIKGNGCYHGLSGIVRKYVCRTCGGVFNDRTGTAFYDLRTPEEKVLLSLEMILRGMPLRKVADILHVKLDTVRGWLSQSAEHAEKVNEALVKRIRVERVELDELWTFVRKKNFRGWQKAKREMMVRCGSGSPTHPCIG